MIFEKHLNRARSHRKPASRLALNCLRITPYLTLTVLAAILLLFGTNPSPAVAQSMNPAVIGQWSGESPWPTVAIHMNILADGRVLTWGQDLPPSAGGVFPTYVVTIPSGSTNTSSVVRLDLDNELFCAGETFLPDGRVWASGGQEALIEGIGIPVIQIFDPATTSWSLGPSMSGKRWYPTATTLPDGEILNVAGSFDENFTANRIPDVSNSHGTGMRSLTAVAGVPVDYNYPRAFVAPNGKVFIAGMEPITRYLDTSGTGAYTRVANTFDGFRGFGTAVMYDIGKILIAGGAYDDASVPLKTAEVINLNVASPSWRKVAPMARARTYLNATIMADGKILISGGNSAAGEQDATDPALPAEIWDAATEQFTTVASMPHFRTYHSTAGLLPDGRVLSAGSTAPKKPSLPDQLNADFYSPPYLFKGARPTIISAPALVHYRQQFDVVTPDSASISNVNWIRLSAVTHHFNFNQRINRLSFTKGAGALTVTAPPDPNVCPPGHYMTFILNSSGAASVAKVVQILPDVAPTPGGRLKWIPKAIKFGKVRVGQSKVRTLKIKNTGMETLTCSVQQPGMAQFTLGSGAEQFTVKPKGSASIAVRFTPTTTGPASSSIQLTSSDSAHTSVKVGLIGTGK